MRIKKNINWGLLIDPTLNSLNLHYKNCMVDSKENDKFDLGVKGLKEREIRKVFHLSNPPKFS